MVCYIVIAVIDKNRGRTSKGEIEKGSSGCSRMTRNFLQCLMTWKAVYKLFSRLSLKHFASLRHHSSTHPTHFNLFYSTTPNLPLLQLKAPTRKHPVIRQLFISLPLLIFLLPQRTGKAHSAAFQFLTPLRR